MPAVSKMQVRSNLHPDPEASGLGTNLFPLLPTGSSASCPSCVRVFDVRIFDEWRACTAGDIPDILDRAHP